jgi:signal transduction histidine kinase
MYKIILSIIYIVSFGILFNCSNYLIRYGRTRREIKWFVASLGCVQLWFVSQILIFIATDEIQLKMAYLIGNFGICLIGSSWIKFIFVFKEKKNRIADILVVISLMMYGVICTNKYHSLYYKRFTMGNIIYGKLFYINIIFDYLCVISGIIIIWRNFSNIKNGTKVKIVLSFSVIIPLICNYIYQNIFKDLKFDLTPIGFSITCMFVLLVTFKLNIFNIKDYILNDFIQNTEDGIFILDNNNLPIYYNESFKTIFDIDSAREDILTEILENMNDNQRSDLNDNYETIYIDNKNRKYHITKNVYKNGADDIVGTSYIIHNISKYYDLKQQQKNLIIYKQQRQIEKERNRMVQVIHDSLGHDLTMIRSLINLSILDLHNYETKSEEIKTNLTKADNIASNSIKELRLAINNFEPINSNSLVSESIIQLCETITTMKIEVTIQGNDGKKYAYLSRNLYQNLKEIITNTLKYSSADKMEVILRFQKDEIDMFVFDNGKGCDKLIIGRGLGGIIERTEEVGGNVKFNTKEGEGFQTIIQLPIKNKNEIYSFK